MDPHDIRAARVVLPCADLSETVAFFGDLGFRVDAISPADDPSRATLSGHGLRIELQRGWVADPGLLRLTGPLRPPTVAPNGTRIEWDEADPPVVLPPVRQERVVSRGGEWVVGRAGMRYRDLLPGRLGGRFVASRIQIPEGGPVPDYVHFHRIRLQLIYCVRGWVRVVYEDQGAPFVMEPGDCVLQPPEIRHRVLEASPGLEVIEVGCPAEHATVADHALALPNGVRRPERDFGGQRFVRHRASDGEITRIREATDGLADVRVVRTSAPITDVHRGELLFRAMLGGAVTLRCDGYPDERLVDGDSFAIPAGMVHTLAEPVSAEWLEVRL